MITRLDKVYGFNVSVYNVDPDSGRCYLLSDCLEPDYYKAVQAKRRYEAEQHINTKVVINNAIYIK